MRRIIWICKKMAEQNKLLELRVGSHLYGLNTPESDEDFFGIFIPYRDFIFGLNHVEEVDLSVISKKLDGRNDKDALDKKFFTLKKFMKLAIENNPNILEILFVNKENVIFETELGKVLLENRHLFLHQGLKEKFLGYAFSQKKRK